MSQRVRKLVTAVAFAGSILLGTSVTASPVVGAASAIPAVSAQVTPGAFCKTADIGKIGYSKNNVKMVCSTAANDTRARWRQVVK